MIALTNELYSTVSKMSLKKTLLTFISVLSVAWMISSSNSLALNYDFEQTVVSQAQLDEIAKKIYQNETGSNPDYLIAWNEGENFASLGLGHFIWFPKGLVSPFTETFPDLLSYLQSKNVALPDWIDENLNFPFESKEAFLNAKDSEKMLSLQRLMLSTFSHQVNFIYQRMQRALPAMLNENLSPLERKKVRDAFYQLANTQIGLYSLIDYVNFKGEGTAQTERYNGEGWGLLQVLLNMQENQNLHQAFSDACKFVLNRRVQNSPQKELESKWIRGWERRCDTYRLS